MLCTFIPPHMSKKAAEQDRSFAVALKIDTTLRTERAEGVSVAGPIRMYDAQGRRVLPGAPLSGEMPEAARRISGFSADAALALGIDVFPDGVVRYGKSYANAFFNGSFLVFGEGDGQVFGDFTASRDIFAHEFGHALVSLGPRLSYAGEPGALNEHLADVFGVVVQQHATGDATGQDWRIGQEILLDGVSAVRDMMNPGSAYDNDLLGRDPQPGHMDHYVKTRADNGGVHLNSGIPNRAFALLCQLTGEPSWGRPLAMWRRAMQDIGKNSGFSEFAMATWRHSGGLNPAVKEAWTRVGVRF